jgi:hypothetical protein
MRLASTGDLRGNTGSVQWCEIFVVVVAAICLNGAGSRQRPATFAANRRNRFDKQQQLSDVVTVRTRNRESDALRFGVETVF